MIDRVKDDQLKQCLIQYQEDGDPTKIDAVQSGGCTMLQMAASSGELEALKALLKAGAKPNAEGRHKRAPLNVAALDPDIIQALVDSGVDVNHQDRDGNTLLHDLIVRLASSISSLQDLLQAQAQAETGAEAIMLLVGHPTTKINLKNNAGQTPLACFIACFPEPSEKQLRDRITQLGREYPSSITGDPYQMAVGILSSSDPWHCIKNHPHICDESVRAMLLLEGAGYLQFRRAMIDAMQPLYEDGRAL